MREDAPLRQGVIERLGTGAVRDRASMRLSRARGCLIGGAIGDALGAPVEFLSRAEIVATRGVDGSRGFEPMDGVIGAVTDDTQMTLFTAEGLLRAHVRFRLRGIGPVYATVVDRAYARWLATQDGGPDDDSTSARPPDGWLITHRELFARRAPGATCLAALRSKTRAGDPARNTSKGCGAVMRIAPIGLFAAGLYDTDVDANDRFAFELATEVAALTHGHATGQLTAAFAAVVIGALVAGCDWRHAVDRALRRLTLAPGREETRAAVANALHAAESKPDCPKTLAALGEGWIAEEALAIGLYCAAGVVAGVGANERASEGAVRRALHLAVEHDGDSDSTGAIAGNLLGAMVGFDGLPEAWRSTVELADVIGEVAEDLVLCSTWDVSDYSNTPESAYWARRYPGS